MASNKSFKTSERSIHSIYIVLNLLMIEYNPYAKHNTHLDSF